MRAVLQRVSKAKVVVDGRVVGAIRQGFVVLLGVTHEDNSSEAQWLADKIAGLRLFEDENGKLNLALAEVEGAVLLVPQFTLYGDARKGRRPSFTKAASPEHAEPLIEHFARRMRERGLVVETGVFGATMTVEIHNDGPVTLILEK